MTTRVDLAARFGESCFLSGAHARPAFAMGAADGDVLVWARFHAANDPSVFWTAHRCGLPETEGFKIA
jgi:hypothetical protein